MEAIIDPDVHGGAAHRNMLSHLAGPFTAGATEAPLSVTPAGRVALGIVTRDPVVLVAPKEPLDDRTLVITAVLDPDGAAQPVTPAVTFAPYTEAGAFLPLHVPPVDPERRTAAPFVLELALQWHDRDGNVLATPVPDVSALVQVQLLEGTLGKVLVVLGAEKARMRRQLREILAMRALGAARWDALDRFGADLGVPRFADRLQYDAASGEILAVTRESGGEPVAEPDADYRRRLGLYHRWGMPTRANLLHELNGPGAATDPNAGALGQLGLAQRLQIEERNNPLAIAVHVVAAPGQAATRTRFFQFVAANLLVWPAQFAVNDPHQARLLGTVQRARLEAQRQLLRDGFNWTQAMAIAPALAAALERVARVRQVLGITTRLTVQRAFDAAGGSRYEMGHGIDLVRLTAAELDTLRTRLATPSVLAALDEPTRALLAGLQPQTAVADPLGRWLLEGCGLLTVHPLNATTVYLSALPTFGLVVHEANPQPGDGLLALEAMYHAAGDPGANAVLESAVADSLAAWTAGGGLPVQRITYAQAQARWRGTTAQPNAARTALLAAGLAAPAALPPLAPSMDKVPAELVAAIELGPALSGQVIAGNSNAVTALRTLASLLRTNHAASVLAFVSAANQVTVLVGAIGLPQAGVNLSERRATGFRWYTVPIEGNGGYVTPVGARAKWRAPASARLTAIVVIGYARRGGVDPYEYRVDLPDGAQMNLAQYEFLMNALERYYPLGVQVNTFNIRRRRVDLDGAPGTEPLPPMLARTYRKFQRRHRRGESGVGLEMPADPA